MKSLMAVMGVSVALGWVGFAHAVTVNPEELAEARRWGAARFEGIRPQRPVEDTFFSTDPPFSFVYGGKPSAELLRAWPLNRISPPAPSHETAPGKTEHTLV